MWYKNILKLSAEQPLNTIIHSCIYVYPLTHTTPVIIPTPPLRWTYVYEIHVWDTARRASSSLTGGSIDPALSHN